MDNICLYYDPVKNQIWEGVYYSVSSPTNRIEYRLLTKTKLKTDLMSELNITENWIPERFIFIGSL